MNKLSISVLGIISLCFLSACGATPESIAEEACRCEKTAGADEGEIAKCRDTAKAAGEAFKNDPEAMDRGIKVYNDCLNTTN